MANLKFLIGNMKWPLILLYTQRYVKATIILGALFVISIGVPAQDKAFHVGAGATYNFVKNVSVTSPMDQTGFYVSASETGKLTKHLGYTGSGVFTNQRIVINGIEAAVNNIGCAMYFNYYPMKEGLKVLAGFQIGLILSAKANNQEIDGYTKGYLSFNYGLGYEFKKFEITARSNGMISSGVFDNYLTLGAGYRIF
jgi:hypothetical protein